MKYYYSRYYHVQWPEYQKLEEKDGFGDHSIYDINNNAYFVEQEWLDNLK